ncbi:hypothetical protein HELRODRAFT_62889 [Helobdella robusta]|uniref:MSP domain-containing protein n=1 Tax=Helobdella robusta TaxID=6412 RepID=T1FX69_HELRO|nr:hypothetical protein HELRODRAFT_62889 [Helobdella robusta]ESO12293.1 hypothetical protein HELRODRAFT_62889 [Helobdella robusta]
MKFLFIRSCRWVIPACSDHVVQVQFQSDTCAQLDQTYTFQVVGNKNLYPVSCRAFSGYPGITGDPKVVFACRVKCKKENEIVHKKYVMSNGVFEFGPLIVGKPKDKYRECVYEENVERLNIMNISLFTAEVSFAFHRDDKEEVFMLHPPFMVLASGEKKELFLWAYPKANGLIEDTLVCCVKDNPQPVLFKISCEGVTPELVVNKELLFDKVLLHRRGLKALVLTNNTAVPVAWKLSGHEGLGEEFSVGQCEGVVPCKSTCEVPCYFKASKPIVVSKKTIRLEVYDVENLLGLIHTNNVQVSAEAYDVALDISFPKGSDGGLDYGLCKVCEENKLVCTLRNKGKYDINYRFQSSVLPLSHVNKKFFQVFNVSN